MAATSSPAMLLWRYMRVHDDASPSPSESLEDSANWFSFIFMTYLDSLFAKGSVRTLEMSDLGGISKQDCSDVLHESFSAQYAEECRRRPDLTKRSLWAVLWRTVGYWKLFLGIALFALSAALQFGPVLILTRLVRYFQGVQYYSTGELWLLVCLLMVFPIVGAISLAHSNAVMAHMGAQIRNTLIGVIYRKSLKISPYQRQSVSTGRIITMFSEDTNQIRNFLYFLNNFVCAPLQIAACLYLIYEQVGPSTFVGLGYAVLTIPISGVVFGIVFKIRQIKMKDTDARVKLMNEVMNGIRIIKYYAWEGAFIEKIGKIRDSEVFLLAKGGYIFNAVFGLFLLGAPQIQTVLIFLTYIGLGHQLDAAKAFTTLTLFGLMTSPFIFIPFGLQQYNQSLLAMKRILQFMDCDDMEQYISTVDSSSDDVIVEFKDTCLAWTPKDEEVKEAPKGSEPTKYEAVSANEAPEAAKPEDFSNKAIHTLRNINLKVKRGQLVGIVGTVGSGKSSLLSSILGEMHLRSGELILTKKSVNGTPTPLTIAYCDQRPWIVNATVKDNILFGLDFNEDRFKSSLHAACMDDDLKILSAGVETEIGERGINLSGGQKARVALARAVYNDADIYLLDDPLSAVDAHVGEHIFSKCIKGALDGKTRFLVTHHLHVLNQCDFIVILDGNGTVIASGTHDEIMKSGIDVEKYLGVDKTAAEGEPEKSAATEEATAADQQEVTSSDAKPSQKHSEGTVAKLSSKRDDTKTGGELITKEEKKEGAVSFKTYWLFIEYGGAFIFAIVVFFQLASQVLNIEANFWLSDWGKETTIDNYVYNRDMSRERTFHWFRGYAGMQMASIFFMFSSRIVLNYHRTGAAKTFHVKLLQTVLYLPVSFFDVTPIGRILNRFSQDMSTIDEEMAQSLSQLIGMGGGVLGSLGAIAGSTKGTFLILAVPLGYLYSHFQSYFRMSNTAIARLEAVSRSPIYADFSQTLSGTSTIRAYQQQGRFIHTLEEYANRNTVPGIFQQIAGQWLAIRLDFLGALIMFFMGALTVSLQHKNFIPAGYLALGLSYAIQLTALLKMAVRVSSTLEAQFNAVERVRFYVDLEGVENDDVASKKIDAVANTGDAGDIEMNSTVVVKQTVQPPADWPQHGNVRFENVAMGYRDGPLVLKGVSFSVASKDKIGIAGRTGCGKSSLMVALFRIEKLAAGRIIIDDIDISTIPLKSLRSKLCIIPQDPVMFSATVRFNLDPFNDFSDNEVWEVLKSVNMVDHVESLPNKLEELVAEGGDNFSAGQRQLICIARAILRKPKILVMDEATASIDSETDAFIQTMIRTKFADCTVLTIAHRLHTIIDSTNILVMDKGYVGEFDSPEVLLTKPQGLFKGLWDRHISEGSSNS